MMRLRQLTTIVLQIVLQVAVQTMRVAAAPPLPVVLDRIISREDPSLEIARSRLAVGRDGMVYLSSNAFILRLDRTGAQKTGGHVVSDGFSYATANAAGVIAASNSHFDHSIHLYDHDFKPIGAVNSFVNNDKIGWSTPWRVEAGASGDFYAMDQQAGRVVRISPTGKIVTSYPYKPSQGLPELRVCEKLHRFFWLTGGVVHCVDPEGQEIWTCPAPGIGGNPWDGYSGGMDVDEEGNLYLLGPETNVLQMIGPDGKPAGKVSLAMGDHAPTTAEPINDMRINGGDLVLKRRDPTELFQVYNLHSGAFKTAIAADVERLSVSYPSSVWTAGQPESLKIQFQANLRLVTPQWKVWLRAYNTPTFEELPIVNGTVKPPANAGGLYQLRVNPGINGAESEYTVQSVIEIRQPGSSGSVSVWTPNSRVFYGQGDAIPLTIALRTAGGAPAPAVTLRLYHGARVLAETRLQPTSGPLTPNSGGTRFGPRPTNSVRQQVQINSSRNEIDIVIPEALTRALAPGRYQVVASASGFTPAPQPLVIGPGLHDASPFRMTLYGDYAATFPEPGFWDASEAVTAHLRRGSKLGINLYVDRLGTNGAGTMGWLRWQAYPDAAMLETLAKQLTDDPLAPAPEKARIEPPLLQSVAGYGALGASQMSILLSMDAGMPLGTGYDNRTKEQFLDALTTTTKALLPYPAFRGWSWAANSWPSKFGADAASTPEQKSAYQAALKKATETGAWDPVLDAVSDNWMKTPPEAWSLFNSTLQQMAPGKINTAAGPYRSVSVYPPVTFRNLDEVDLHYQAEQIKPPQTMPHDVDFQKRPGKPAWGHPELWNDNGTGDQIFPTLFQMIMRGADGIGNVGPIPSWSAGTEDPRDPRLGTVSVFRALGEMARQFGPWLTTLHPADRVALIADGRMFRIDNWGPGGSIGGKHFTRLFEADQACLYAHTPATTLFTEDIGPETLRGYQAVLLVDQEVELEPGLLAALRTAKASGVPVFYDDTCRKGIVQEFRPLGIGFTHVENDPSTWNDDSQYWRYPTYFHADAAALRRSFAGIVTPTAPADAPDVLASERMSGKGRFVFVVNNTAPDVEPGILWRATNYITTHLPVHTTVKLPAGGAIYDVFSRQRIVSQNGTVPVDLRTLPGRLYAIIPAPIARVRLQGPAGAAAGRSFHWEASVLDAAGHSIPAGIPIQVRLLSASGETLSEVYRSANLPGAAGDWTVPIDTTRALTLEATELFSGQQTRIPLHVTPAPTNIGPFRLTTKSLFGRQAGEAFAAKAVVPHVLTANAIAPTPVPFHTSHFTFHTSRFSSTHPSIRPPDPPHPSSLTAQPLHTSHFTVHSSTEPLLPSPFSLLHSSYGPHLRDIAVSSDGRTAFVNAMNLDTNLYALDLQTGQIRWRQRVGDYFAVAPTATPAGVDCWGFDFHTSEGYHLYSLDNTGKLLRRFALYGLPERTLSWASTALVDNTPHFAVSPAGNWIASAGNLGLAVWNRDGHLLWSQDWWKNSRHTVLLIPAGPDNLVVCDGREITAYRASDGQPLWHASPAAAGSLQQGVATPDGQTVAIPADTYGGRIYILRGGKLVDTFVTPSSALALSPDGRHLAAITGRTLKLFAAGKGMQWNFESDDVLHSLRISPDGNRVVVSSELGAVTVLGSDGRLLLDRDMGAVAASAWIPGGDLLLGTWDGHLTRLDSQYHERWSTAAAPGPPPANLFRTSATPTIRMSNWGNAGSAPAPLNDNLLNPKNVLITAELGGTDAGLQNPPALLVDGKPDPPPLPWLGWPVINYIDSGWRGSTSFTLDTLHTLLHVTSITFVEDPAHPESWMRDARLQYWEASKESWQDGPLLLSNSQVHTHTLNPPIDAARFRLVSPDGGVWPVGSFRFGEIVLHGQALGSSHPDVAARRPVAVLFDEDEANLRLLSPITFQYEGAFSGGKCIQVENANAGPAYRLPFGHALPNWLFPVRENPQPGEYRYLQFAWKAMSPQVTGISLQIGPPWPGPGAVLTAGVYPWNEGAAAQKVVDTKPPLDWQTVRVDLWKMIGKPLDIQSIRLAAAGGAARFDQILLARTEADLPHAMVNVE